MASCARDAGANIRKHAASSTVEARRPAFKVFPQRKFFLFIKSSLLWARAAPGCHLFCLYKEPDHFFDLKKVAEFREEQGGIGVCLGSDGETKGRSGCRAESLRLLNGFGQG